VMTSLGQESATSTSSLKDYIDLCTNASACLGLKIRVKKDTSPINVHLGRGLDVSLPELSVTSPYHTDLDTQMGYIPGTAQFINKENGQTASTLELLSTINRNVLTGGGAKTVIHGGSGGMPPKVLKKMPYNFQNIDDDGKTNSESSTGLKNYDLNYDKPDPNHPTCSNYPCPPNYKPKNPYPSTCSNGCKRTDCCELNICVNNIDSPSHTSSCPTNTQLINNGLCSGSECNADECCKTIPSPPPIKVLKVMAEAPTGRGGCPLCWDEDQCMAYWKDNWGVFNGPEAAVWEERCPDFVEQNLLHAGSLSDNVDR